MSESSQPDFMTLVNTALTPLGAGTGPSVLREEQYISLTYEEGQAMYL
jgi:hypothetical protein